DSRLALVVGLPTHGPWEVLWVIPFGRTGRDEQLRHLPCIHIFLDGTVRRRAERVEDQEDFVALDQLARLLHRFWRTVGIVIGNEVDLAAVDAAFGVDHAEVGRLGPANHAIGRRRPAVGHDVADLDLRVSNAGIVFLLGNRAATASSKQDEGGRKRRHSSRDEGHSASPCNERCMCLLLSRTSFGSLAVNTLSRRMSIWRHFVFRLAYVTGTVLLMGHVSCAQCRPCALMKSLCVRRHTLGAMPTRPTSRCASGGEPGPILFVSGRLSAAVQQSATQSPQDDAKFRIRTLVPTFRSSCSIAARPFTNFGKSWAVSIPRQSRGL